MNSTALLRHSWLTHGSQACSCVWLGVPSRSGDGLMGCGAAGATPLPLCRMGIVLAIVLPPSHEETPITSLQVHLVPSDAGYVVLLFLWLQVLTQPA